MTIISQNNVHQKALKLREEEIIQLLLRFRFLTSTQIQILLNHKSKDKPLKWLQNLTKEHYIHRFYKADFYNLPATFCLGKGSIPYLRSKKIPNVLLKRIYKEKELTGKFKNHCVFIASIYLSLIVLVTKTQATLTYHSKTDLFPFDNLLSPLPDAYFVIKEKDGVKRRYFLDVFLPAKPWRTYRLRIQGYIKYYKSNQWQMHAQRDFPEIILICPTEAVMWWLVKTIVKIGSSSPQFYLALRQDIQTKGLCKDILRKIEINK